MKSRIAAQLLGGAAFGAALMYFLDPNIGRRRRALVRDKVVHAGKVINEAGKVTARDAAQRAYGVIAGTKRLFQRGDVTDEVLVGRVRAALGRVVSHPHAIEVSAHSGHVAVSGPILAEETRALLACIRKVPGVRAVSDQLSVYQEPGNVSALQGGHPRRGMQWELMQDSWSPAARLMTGMVGTLLMMAGARQRSAMGLALGAVGGGLLARATTNHDLRSLVGMGRHGITVQKVVNVSAPVDRVFGFWADYRNFPRFMSHVREVRPVDDHRSKWVVAGPAGVPVQWIAEVTRVVPGTVIEWKSDGGDGAVRHAGSVRFDPNQDGGTRVCVRLTYLPPAGAFGHAVAKLFGADPKSEMDADLLRMKTMIETGNAPHDAARRMPRES
jgi:uncharacterized membrane protein